MKFSKVLLALTLFAYFAFLVSCSKDSSVTDPTDYTNSKFTYTLDGGGFSNQKFSFANFGGTVYSAEEDQTVATFGTMGNDGGIIGFKGKSTGTFQVNENSETNALVLYSGSSQVITLTSGTITVTSYGSVGGEVKGTFSGTGVNSINGQLVQITNGTFAAKRLM